jgi:hypothetical protein
LLLEADMKTTTSMTLVDYFAEILEYCWDLSCLVLEEEEGPFLDAYEELASYLVLERDPFLEGASPETFQAEKGIQEDHACDHTFQDDLRQEEEDCILKVHTQVEEAFDPPYLLQILFLFLYLEDSWGLEVVLVSSPSLVPLDLFEVFPFLSS